MSRRPRNFELAIARAKAEVRERVTEKGYILRNTELEVIMDHLQTAFPKARRVDIIGLLNIDRDKIVNQRYDIDLHRFVSAREESDIREPRTFDEALGLWAERRKRRMLEQ